VFVFTCVCERRTIILIRDSIDNGQNEIDRIYREQKKN
jgi:hypothetical protein